MEYIYLKKEDNNFKNSDNKNYTHVMIERKKFGKLISAFERSVRKRNANKESGFGVIKGVAKRDEYDKRLDIKLSTPYSLSADIDTVYSEVEKEVEKQFNYSPEHKGTKKEKSISLGHITTDIENDSYVIDVSVSVNEGILSIPKEWIRNCK